MSLTASLARASDDVTHTRARLLALSPASTLRRGYAIVQHHNDGVVRGAAEVRPGELLTVRFAEDQLTVRAGDDGARDDRARDDRAGDDRAGDDRAGDDSGGG
jgi:exodeoxyribonuclease VII large subunit